MGCLKLIKFFSGEKCEDLLSQNKSIWFYIYSINISNPPEIGRNCIPFINEVWTLIGPTSLETPKQWFRLVLNEIQLQARQSQQEQSSWYRTSEHDCHSSCKMNADPEKVGGGEPRTDSVSQRTDPVVSCSAVTESDELHQVQMRWFRSGITLKENGFHWIRYYFSVLCYECFYYKNKQITQSKRGCIFISVFNSFQAIFFRRERAT